MLIRSNSQMFCHASGGFLFYLSPLHLRDVLLDLDQMTYQAQSQVLVS